MENFKLKFGKYKGLMFLSTPVEYQNWLLSQDWFKKPEVLTPFQQAQKNISNLSDKLRGWDGYSAKGFAIESAIFENEMAIEDVLYCNCGRRKDPDEKDCGMDCGF